MERDTLDQQLLELVYGLLPDEEASALRQRIDTEPDVARAYTEAKRTADLFARASRVEPTGPILRFRVPAESTSMPPVGRNGEAISPADNAVPLLTPPRSPAPRLNRVVGWLFALAATIVFGAVVGSHALVRFDVDRLAANHMRVVVTGPSKLMPHMTNYYAITTTDVTGEPRSVDVEYGLYSRQGEALVRERVRTGSDGQLVARIPDTVAVSDATRFEVSTTNGEKSERFEAAVNVETVRFVTHLSLDKPLYQPGETVYYRSLTLERFGMDVRRLLPIEFEIRDPSGAVVASSRHAGITEHGVGSGAFVIPRESRGGEYTLVARSLDGSFPEEKRPFLVRHYRVPRLKKDLELLRDSYAPGDRVVANFSAKRAEGGAAAGAKLRVVATIDDRVAHELVTAASDAGTAHIEFTLPAAIEKGNAQLAVVVDDGGTIETIAKTIRINLGKVDVAFFPEGGQLVADLENRVYFTGRNPIGEPMHIEGRIVDGQGAEVAALETVHKGMGSFRFKPRREESYSLKITQPTGISGQIKLPAVAPDARLVLTTESDVYDANQPIELRLITDQENTPVVVSAYCRGVQVGQHALTTKSGNNHVSLPVTPEASGTIRLTVYDYRGSPPRPVAERLVYRRPHRQLHVRVADHSEAYAPGDSVGLKLLVTNENGEPVPAVLGVAVVDDSLLKMADDDTASMTTHFFLTTEIEKPEDLEKADFYLSDDPKAPTALDLLLGTQGWRRFIERKMADPNEAETDHLHRIASLDGIVAPPTVLDNLERVQKEWETDRTAVLAKQSEWNQRLGLFSFVAGVSMIVLIAIVAIMRLASGVALWVPSLGAAVACLAFGFARWQEVAQSVAATNLYAFVDYETAPKDVARRSLETESRVTLAKEGSGALEQLKKMNDRFADLGGEDLLNGFALVDARLGEPLFGVASAPFSRHKQLAPLDDRRMARLEMGIQGGRGGAMPEESERLTAAWGRFALPAGAQGVAANDSENLRQLLKQYRFPVREYAHVHTATEPGVRRDFTETLLWKPVVIADEKGQAAIEFDLSDSVTTFLLRAAAHGSGRIGSASAELLSRIPFNLEPKLPLQVDAGDRIDLPVAVNNDTQGDLPVKLKLQSNGLLTVQDSGERQLTLAANERTREYFQIAVTGETGEAEIDVRADAGSLGDAIRRTIEVVPPGFPAFQSYSGRFDGDQNVSITLPAEWVPGSLEVTATAFPSTLADLQRGIESILREPVGCFEQASTSNYPNVLALAYMEEHDMANPEMARKAREMLQRGYAKLTSYESRGRGYEWFGADPAHEALTAYGLMQFRDMRSVYPVDDAMIDRTAQWLLARRDGKGGFQRNSRALDSFGGAPQHITDAYIVWALTESGQTGLEAEVQRVIGLGRESDDPYLLALAGASAVNAQRADDAKQLLDKLAEAQEASGRLQAKETSITRSGGISLTAETTALAALAWLKLPAYHQNADKAVQWLVEHRQGAGGWGSTQGTILALKALVAHAKVNRKTVTGGDFLITRNGETLGKAQFAAGHNRAIEIEGLASKLEPGENPLVLRLTGENKMPYSVEVRYRTRTPVSDPGCPVQLSMKLGREQVRAGDTVSLAVSLLNKTAEGQPMTVAILGLPAGLQPRPDQLEALKKAGTIDYFETRAREVICYWRSLAGAQKIDFQLDLVAEWPGQYTGPASRAYLYYTAEQKHWNEPLTVAIGRE